VATRKTTKKTPQKGKSQGGQAVVIFWLVFIIVIISVFMLNAETIKKNFNLFKTRMAFPQGTEEPVTDEQSATPAVEPSPQRAPQPAPEPVTITARPAPEPPAPETTPQTQTPTPQVTPPTPTPQVTPPQVRERAIYFAQIDRDGQILQSRTVRRIPVSESPMMDALNILLAGPSADELKRGILNLIPQNTRILSATVRGSTAYINFNEDFMFNTFGVEGYVAQLRQIVWTVTEFQNISDVQILIEGRVHNYLGEGIWIGSPISRASF
jgi:spore germination protein GerM